MISRRRRLLLMQKRDAPSQPTTAPTMITASNPTVIEYDGVAQAMPVPYPSGAQNGDVVFFLLNATNGGTANGRGPWIDVAGLTTVEVAHDANHSSKLYYRVIDGTEGVNESFTNTGNPNGGQGWGTSFLFRGSGFDGNYIDYSKVTFARATSISATAPTVGATYENTLAITFAAIETIDSPTITSTGWTQGYTGNRTSTPGTREWVYTQSLSSTGEDCNAFSWTNANTRENVVYTVYLIGS